MVIGPLTWLLVEKTGHFLDSLPISLIPFLFWLPRPLPDKFLLSQSLSPLSSWPLAPPYLLVDESGVAGLPLV